MDSSIRNALSASLHIISSASLISLSCRELDFEKEETTNARMTVNRYIRFLIVSVFTYFRIARIRVMLSPHAIKWLFSHPKKSWWERFPISFQMRYLELFCKYSTLIWIVDCSEWVFHSSLTVKTDCENWQGIPNLPKTKADGRRQDWGNFSLIFPKAVAIQNKSVYLQSDKPTPHN